MFQTDLNKISDKPLTDKCIILDLDETLVHTQSDENVDFFEMIFTDPAHYYLQERCYKITMEDVVVKRGTGRKDEMWGIKRPYLREFLIACFNYFRIVIVWSAGRKNYVHTIVDQIFRDLPRPHVIFTFDDLEELHDKTFIKPLNKLINTVPGLNKYMSLENAVIVDDRNTVFQEPNPYNGIQIPAYKPSFTLSGINKEDTALLELKNWLLKPEVIESKDIRKINKTQIFSDN